MPKIYKSSRKKSQEQENLALKNSWFSEIFFFYETKLPVSKKITCFHAMLENFLVSKEIFYCGSEVIVFQLYHELNAVRFENSELSHEISCILPVFSKMKAHLCKIIVDLKNINSGKVHIPAISRENCKFCQY